MRVFLLCVIVIVGGYIAWILLPPRLAAHAPPAPPPSPREIKECRDRCEQRQILAGGDTEEQRRSEEELRACRRRCGGEAASRPHEVPSRITVAPAKRDGWRPRSSSKLTGE
jgi:hypothetical protein